MNRGNTNTSLARLGFQSGSGVRAGALALLLCSLSCAGLGASLDARLLQAAKNKDSAEVRALLRQKVDANAIAPDGDTALHWAAHLDDLQTAEMLLRAGANA